MKLVPLMTHGEYVKILKGKWPSGVVQGLEEVRGDAGEASAMKESLQCTKRSVYFFAPWRYFTAFY